MENKKLLFHIPRENKEDFQSIMNSVDMNELYKAEDKMKQLEYLKKDSMRDNGILNNIDWDSEPKKLIYSNKMLYAFIYHEADYALWTKRATQTMDTKEWTEVSSLLDVPMFSYLELRKYAKAIGWINEDNHNWLIER
tara:strand:- start:534 stop:947 length:414 start_codon:yes stop_codon:yes gene_type:complete